jgi:hypothetical protein
VNRNQHPSESPSQAADDVETTPMMNHRPKLKLNRRAQAPAEHTGETPELTEQLEAQTIAAELVRMFDKPFSAADVAAELGCATEVADVLGSYLMPRGQRFHVRRVLTSIAAYLRLDAERLRELLGRGDGPDSGTHQHDDGPGGGGESRGPRVVVVHRRGGRGTSGLSDGTVAAPAPAHHRFG